MAKKIHTYIQIENVKILLGNILFLFRKIERNNDFEIYDKIISFL